MPDYKVCDLIATYEEFFVPQEEHISYWYGDYGIHVIKNGTSDKKINEVKDKALEVLGLSEESYLRNPEYSSRFNIVRDFVKNNPSLEPKLSESEKEYLNSLNHKHIQKPEVYFQFSEMKITEIKDNTVSDLKQIRKNIAEAKEIKNGKELLDVMTEQARNWKPTFQEYKEMLDFRAKFYRYSMRNVSLIYLQNPNASYVGSFKHFKDLGYNINKGEHGMLIFAPRTLAMAEVNPGDWRSMKELTDEQRAALKNGSLTIKDKTYFVKGYVFDISQTDCPQEDLPKLLRGMSAKVEAEDYYTALKNITEDYGIGFSEENLKSVALKGYFAPSEERIVINERLSVTDKATVLTHELSHALLHANSTELSVSQIEFEAESTAYIALKQSSFDMSDYSFRYIQSYLKSLTPEELQKALTRIDNCGNLLCEKLKEQLEISRLPNIEHCQEIGITDN